MSTEIDKLKYHISMLAEALPSNDETFLKTSIIENDWSEDDFSAALDIMDKYEKIIISGNSFTHYDVEKDFMKELNFDRQSLKIFIIGLFREGRFIDTIQHYTNQCKCSEFDNYSSRGIYS